MEITRYQYKKRPTKKMGAKLWMLVAAAVLLVSGSGTYVYTAFAKELPVVSLSVEPVSPAQPQEVHLPWPTTGQAAVGSLEDGVLASSASEEQARPIASMTKVITALAVLQQSPLAAGEQGQTYTFTPADATMYSQYIAKNGSVVPVSAGQTMTQYQVLQALLLASANNIADSLVVRHFGSMEAYLVYANNMLKEYGLSKTVVADASGFSPQTVSTPSELIVIGQKALANPVLAAIVAQVRADIPGVGTVNNTNRLLSDSTVVGIKTGTTDEAGNCLLFAARHAIDDTHSVTVVGVIMGDSGAAKLFADARTLLAAARQGFGKVEVVPAGTVVGQAKTVWGEQTDVVTFEPLLDYGWLAKPYAATVQFDQPSSELSAGRPVGKLTLLGGSDISVTIRTQKELAAPDSLWRLAHVF